MSRSTAFLGALLANVTKSHRGKAVDSIRNMAWEELIVMGNWSCFYYTSVDFDLQTDQNKCVSRDICPFPRVDR